MSQSGSQVKNMPKKKRMPPTAVMYGRGASLSSSADSSSAYLASLRTRTEIPTSRSRSSISRNCTTDEESRAWLQTPQHMFATHDDDGLDLGIEESDEANPCEGGP